MSATEQKHTPGPWEWDGRVWQYDEQEEAPWLVQAPWHDIKSKAVLSGSIRCNTEADARLIAAAPTMYSYIETKALNGDDEAKQILEAIHASR